MNTEQKTLSCPLLFDRQNVAFSWKSWPKYDNLLNVNSQVDFEGNSMLREMLREMGQKTPSTMPF